MYVRGQRNTHGQGDYKDICPLLTIPKYRHHQVKKLRLGKPCCWGKCMYVGTGTFRSAALGC